MRTTIAYVLALGALVVTVACGGLSRGTARDLISQNLSGPVALPVYINGSRITETAVANDKTELGALYRLGYLKCETLPGSVNNSNPYFPIVTPAGCLLVLTEKGQRAEWQATYSPKNPTTVVQLTVPVAEPELVEVTGVTEDGPRATATFTWRQRPLNDIGEALGYGQVQASTATFQKFDDGWRIVGY
jgi:hypothetical protein